MIHVRVLGTAEVLVGEHTIRPESAMMFALALYLSVTAGQRMQRSRLLELFWPEMADGPRRHALRQLLYRLRRDGFPLSLDGDELLVCDSDVESDLRRVLAARWPDTAGDDDVWSAECVLPGFQPSIGEAYREWLDELRSRVESQYRRALLRKIEQARHDGRWYDASEWSLRCLTADPLNEEATLAHAEAIAMTGSKAKALQIIDRYLDDLGDRRRVIGLPARVLRRRVSESSPREARTEGVSAPFVGREREIARLNDVLAGTLSGEGAAVFVVGAAGIGKSRLSHTLLDTAALRGWRTLSTRLQAGDAQRPLGVFVDLFGALMQLSGALGCAPESMAQLRLLTAHDVRERAESQRSQEAEAVQDRLRAAGKDLLESVATDGPLVLMIDDLHWCDEASVRLLQFLVSRAAALPVMWLLTARPEGRYEVLLEALSTDQVEMMRVTPLAPEKAAALFASLAVTDGAVGATLDSGHATDVAGGNPLYILELARHLREAGQATSLPPSLRALIRDRAARLSPTAQHVLHTCAVLGRYSSVARVSSVLEISTAELLASIEELDALGIVGSVREAEVLSIHDLWRDELLTQLLPASRKLLHHRCGLVLESECRISRSPSIVWEAAQHLLASGAEGRALSLLEECAQHQLDNGLPIEAANSFDLAYRASTTDADRLRALNGRIAALRKAADWAEISTLVRPAMELSATCGSTTSPHSDLELLETEVMWRTESALERSLDRSLRCISDPSASSDHRADAALHCAIVADNICKFSELQMLNERISQLAPASPGARASLLGARLIYETILGSLDEARERGLELILLERATGSVKGLARALRFASHSTRMLGHFAEALAMSVEALELAEKHSLAGDAASAADLILSGYLERSDVDAAALWLPRSIALASKVKVSYSPASLAINRAIFELMTGNHERAMRNVQPYEEKFKTDPVIRQRMLYLSIVSRVYVARSDWACLKSVARAFKETLDLRRSTGQHDFHVASYAHTLECLEGRRAAEEYVAHFLSEDRRDRTPPSAEIRKFIPTIS